MMKDLLLPKSQIISKHPAKLKTSWEQRFLPSISFLFIIASLNSADRASAKQNGKKGRRVRKEGKEEKERRKGKRGRRKGGESWMSQAELFYSPCGSYWKFYIWHSTDIHLKLVFLDYFNDSLRKYQIQIFMSMIVTCSLLF